MSPKIIHINNKLVRINYIDKSGTFIIGLRDTPFQAIKIGKKQIEVRTNTFWSKLNYFSISSNSKIRFINELNGESLLCQVVATRVYKDLEDLLQTEGLDRVSSVQNNTFKEVYKRINSLEGYAEGISKYGLIAIEIALVN